MKNILLTFTLFVASICSAAPVLTLTTTPVSGSSPLTVKFVVTCKTCIVYTWNFGDGSNGSGKNQTHVYKTVGTFFPIVAASDKNGLPANGTATIVVTPADPDDAYCDSNNSPLGATTDGPAILPTKCINSALVNTPSPGPVVNLVAGGNLQAAYNALICGQTLSLAHGSTWNGPFQFNSKGCDNQHWITITSNGALPVPGIRVSPTTLPQMAAISLKGGAAANTIPGDHIRFIGIAWLKQPGNALVAFVNTANGNNIIFDRNYAHGNPGEETRRFLDLTGSNNVAVVESWVDELHCIAITGSCGDSQAISGGNGLILSGTYKIVNNYLSAAGENILFGGDAATTTACDIEVRNNYMYKPMSWMPTSSTYVAPTYIVKNLFELKNACRVLLEGNVLENTWGGFSQSGYAIEIGPKNQAGANGANLCPLCFISDVTIRYNYVTTTSGAFGLFNGISDNKGWATAGHSYSVHDDVFDNLHYAGCYGCGQATVEIGSGYVTANPPPNSLVMHDVLINHITLVSVASWPVGTAASMMLNMSGPPSGNTTNTPQITNLVFKNSIFASGSAGLYPTGGGTDNCSVPGPSKLKPPTDMISSCWIGLSLFSGNVIVNYTAGLTWPLANVFPTAWPGVGFVNYKNGNGGNYSLSSTSLYFKKALDGTSPGANLVLINTFTHTAKNGN